MRVCFRSYYCNEQNSFYLYADEYKGDRLCKFLIEDCYEIGLVFIEKNNTYEAYEKNRLKEFAKKECLDFNTDLHVNGAGDLCVAPKNSQQYRKHSHSKDNFINYLLIPFLYSHSFFEKNKVRPWPDYDHNENGNFESYIREDVITTKDVVLYNLFTLKDIGFKLSKLKESDSEYFKELARSNKEAYNGAMKLINDIEIFNLRKHII